MLRVATNVKKLDNTRAIGTFIPAKNPDDKPNPVISVVMKGDTYRGRAYVVNAWYQTAYEPIKNSEGKIIGILYTGIKQKEIESIKKSIVETKIGKTGYVWVLRGKGKKRGEYIISLDSKRDGENIWEQKDGDGNLFIQRIIKRAVKTKNGEIFDDRYSWKNKGENRQRMKKAAVFYFSEWDWVVGISMYEDDFDEVIAGVTAPIGTIVIFIIFILIIVVLSAVVMNFFTQKSIVSPLNLMTTAAENLSHGDFSQEIEFKSDNEIGKLADSFRDMIEFLRIKTDIAQDISKGELTTALDDIHEKDILGKAMVTMKENINSLINEVSMQVVAVREGNIEIQGNSERFGGVWSRLVEEINQLINTFADQFDSLPNPMIIRMKIMKMTIVPIGAVTPAITSSKSSSYIDIPTTQSHSLK